MTKLDRPAAGARLVATAKVTAKGQVTLPVEVRAHLGVGVGDYLRYRASEDGSVVVSRADASFDRLDGVVDVGRPVPDDEIAEAIARARAAMGRPGVARP